MVDIICNAYYTQMCTNPLSPMLEDLEVFFSLTLQVQCFMYVAELKREMDLLYIINIGSQLSTCSCTVVHWNLCLH